MIRKIRRLLYALATICLLTMGCSSDSTADVTTPANSDTVDADSAAVSEQTESSAAVLTSFSATTLDGNTFTQDNLTGKDVTIINFLATFCGPCLNEMPDLAAFAKSLPENVQMVTICLDGEGAEDAVSSILDEAGYDGVTMITADGDLLSLCNAVQYIPTTVFVDSAGNLVGNAILEGSRI